MQLKFTYFFVTIGLLMLGVIPQAHAQSAAVDQPPAVTADNATTMEANVVQIVLNDEHRQGVDWEAIVSDFHTLQLKKLDNPVWADKKYKISVGTVSNEDYAVLLDALDTVGKMVQTPQTPVTFGVDDKQSINVMLGGEISGSLRVDMVLSNSKEGPKLRVEPYVGVVLKDSGKPVAVMLKAHTDVALQDNSTIVIGGITSEQEVTKTHKFPLLGNLPIVGLVFRNQGRLMQKMETVIFLTPRMKSTAVEKET